MHFNTSCTLCALPDRGSDPLYIFPRAILPCSHILYYYMFDLCRTYFELSLRACRDSGQRPGNIVGNIRAVRIEQKVEIFVLDRI